MPIGLMDDIYDFISKFAERLDDLEEVILQQIQQFHLLQFEENANVSLRDSKWIYISNGSIHFSGTKHFGLVEHCWMKLNNKLILSFQGSQSLFHITLRNFHFMYSASNFLKS